MLLLEADPVFELLKVPIDTWSRQNALLLTKAQCPPLCIDPHGEAATWIRQLEDKNGLRTVPEKLLTANVVEMAIRSGTPLLCVEIGETLCPLLIALLERDFDDSEVNHIQLSLNTFPQKSVLLGDTKVDWNPDFRLYLRTCLHHPKFDGSVYQNATVIDFKASVEGLEDRFLNLVINNEHRDLEEQFQSVVETAK